jgi:hypothetical protein
VLELLTLSHKMWLIIRNIYFKLIVEVDTLRNKELTVINIFLSKNLSSRGDKSKNIVLKL